MAGLSASFRHDVAQDAIEHICGYFDEQGLTLVERWHVCESIELAALGIMGDKLREICEGIKESDIESLRTIADV